MCFKLILAISISRADLIDSDLQVIQKAEEPKMLIAAKSDVAFNNNEDRHLFIEFKDPLEYCERFLKKDPKENCRNMISEKRPDWYFASYCDRIFDDDLFIECMKKAQVTMVEPWQLGRCEQPRTDSGIKNCLWQLDAEAKQALNQKNKPKRFPAHKSSKKDEEAFYKPMKLRGR